MNEIIAIYGPRVRRLSTWCALWFQCGNVATPGYRGGGVEELCEQCERERLARAGREQSTTNEETR